MLFAVQSYNNPRTYFRSEIFIVTAIIAWTYLLHAYYKMQNVDYRYKVKRKDGTEDIYKAQFAKRRRGLAIAASRHALGDG